MMNDTFWASDRTGGIPLSPGREKEGGVTRRVPFLSPKPRGTPLPCLCAPPPPLPLPGFFGRILCRWGSASPTCGTFERAFPARCHREESVFPTGEEHLNVHQEHHRRPTSPHLFPSPARRQPLPRRRSPAPRRRGRAATHQLGVERCGEAVDPARVPDHTVEEIGHGQGVTAGVPRSADQQPQQRQRRKRTCGEGGASRRGMPGGAPARPRRPPLTCSPRRPGEGHGHGAAEPVLTAERLRSAGDAPASPIYAGISRR